MIMKHGYKAEDWETAKDEIRQILVERAKKRQTIPYTDVVADIKAIDVPRNSPAFWDMLGEISTAEDASGRGMLTVIVVHGQGDTLPGAGFFKLAKRLGRDTSDKEAFWAKELERVYGSWSATAEKAKPEGLRSSYLDRSHKSRPTSSMPTGSAKLKYPGRSEFIGGLREGVIAGKRRLEKGDPIEIQMKLGGYQGKAIVIISSNDSDEFEVIGARPGRTFSQNPSGSLGSFSRKSLRSVRRRV